MKRTIVPVIALVLLSYSKLFAFGPEGHGIVPEIAFSYLSETAKANVLRYLDTTTIEQASVWMDDMRKNPDYNFMKPWHYINIEKGKNYTPTTDENIVNELIITLNELKHKNTLCTQQVKNDLQILFHLVGDLHQPLHAGYEEDHGGNKVEINFLGEATNLHWVWDEKIIMNQKITKDTCLQLAKTLSPEEISSIQKTDVMAWMNESRSYLENVYDFSGHVLGEEYAKKNAPIVTKRLLYAGLRLAAILEEDFGN